MLTIKLEKGQCIYRLEDRVRGNMHIEPLKVPIINTGHISFKEWYEKNNQVLEYMVSTYIENFNELCGSNYIITIPPSLMSSIREDLLRWIYQSSYNKEKTWR